MDVSFQSINQHLQVACLFIKVYLKFPVRFYILSVIAYNLVKSYILSVITYKFAFSPLTMCYTVIRYEKTYPLASEETVNREFGVYDTIRDNFPKYVVSLDEFDMSRNGIKHRNIRDFLLAEEWN